MRSRSQLLNPFHNFKKVGKAKMTEGACTVRMQRLKELWNRFEDNHFEMLEDVDVDASDNYFTTDIYSQCEESYLINLGLLQDFLYSLKSNTSSMSGASQSTVSAESFAIYQAKLPTFVLPSFSGDIQEWIKFRDTFNEMVLKRPNLPNIYKTHHLCCLERRGGGDRGSRIFLFDNIFG